MPQFRVPESVLITENNDLKQKMKLATDQNMEKDQQIQRLMEQLG